MNKTINRLLCAFLSVFLLIAIFSAAPFAVSAETPTADGVFDEGYSVDKLTEVSWTYDAATVDQKAANTTGQYSATYYYWDASYIYFFIDIDDPGALATTSDVFYFSNNLLDAAWFDEYIVFNNLAQKTDVSTGIASYFGKTTEKGRQYEIIIPLKADETGFTYSTSIVNSAANNIVCYSDSYRSPVSSKKVTYNDSTTWTGSRIDPEAPLNAAAKGVLAKRVIKAINAIGTVTLDSEALIDTARTAYDALPDEEAQTLVTNYTTLTTAEATYADLKSRPVADGVFDSGYTINKLTDTSWIFDKTNNQKASNSSGQYTATYYYWDTSYIYFFIDIDDPASLGASDVFYFSNTLLDAPWYNEYIVFNNLAQKTEGSSGIVSCFGKTTEKGRQYEIIIPFKTGEAGFTFSTATINTTGDKIVCYNDSYGSPVSSKKVTYNDSTTWTGSRIDSEAPLNIAAKSIAVKRVINAIDAIGTVAPESGALINTARTAYDALPDEATKELVTNYAILTAAEEAYAEFPSDDSSVADGRYDESYATDKMTEYSWYFDRNNSCTQPNTEGRYVSTNYYWDEENIHFFINIIDPNAPEYTQDAFYFSNKLDIRESSYFNDLIIFDVNAQKVEQYGTAPSFFGKKTQDGRQYEIIYPRNKAENGFIFNMAIVYAPIKPVDFVVSYGDPFNSPAAAKLVEYNNESTWFDSNIDPDATVLRLAVGVPAMRVVKKINDIGIVKINSKDAIEAARAAYEALSAEEKALVNNLTILEKAETDYPNVVAADAVIKLIKNIGKVTADSKDKIDLARSEYDKLTQEAKDFVSNYDILLKAEADYIIITTIIYGDLNNDKNVTAADALLALQSSVSKITLTETQLIAADVDGKNGVTAADALLILQYSVEKITSFPVQNNK